MTRPRKRRNVGLSVRRKNMRPGQRFKYQRSAAHISKPITSVGKAYTARAFSMSKLVGEDDLLANEFATTPILFIESPPSRQIHSSPQPFIFPEFSLFKYWYQSSRDFTLGSKSMDISARRNGIRSFIQTTQVKPLQLEQIRPLSVV